MTKKKSIYVLFGIPNFGVNAGMEQRQPDLSKVKVIMYVVMFRC
jgi:hypothetical protein